MSVLLLIIIYLAFISLGLPDSLLGSAWPVMRLEFGVSTSTAGVITMIVSLCTVVSSFFSARVIKRLGTYRVIVISVLMTAGALLFIGISNHVFWLFLLALPLGLGAGSIDAALNNYVALHCKAKHMNWLHCCWGIGATAGPMIMSFCLLKDGSWNMGYFTIAGIQFVLAFILFFSRPLWEQAAQTDGAESGTESKSAVKNVLNIKGVKTTLWVLFFYCSAELAAGLWGSSFLVSTREFTPNMGATAVSLYYAGITAGRIVSGFLSVKLNNTSLIRLGIGISLMGILLVFVPGPGVAAVFGLFLMGVGFAPVYPAMMHETPRRFGVENSQKIIGYQMAFAYVGMTFMPMLLGQIAGFTGIGVFPYLQIAFILCMAFSSEMTIRLVRVDRQKQS